MHSAAISALEKGAQWALAIELLRRTQRSGGVVPNLVTYNAAISACEKGRRWSHAVQLFQDAVLQGLSPDLVMHSALISACEKGIACKRRC